MTSTSTDKYTLYGLTTSPGAQNVSTFVNVTLSDLAILGVPYDLKPLTFPQIRGWLAKETGNDAVTVPTLKTGAGYVTDSWEVAKYLEKHHSTPTRSLFSGSEASAHLDPWVMKVLAPVLRSLFRPLFFVMQDRPSREYFMRTKYQGKTEELLSDLETVRDPARLTVLVQAARAALKGFEEKLGATDGAFVLGDRPSHADSAVFGWYLTTRVNGDAARQVWEHSENPRVKAWVKAMTRVTGLEPEYDLVPKLRTWDNMMCRSGGKL